MIPLQSSRVATNFSVEIFDWNQFEQAKSLGEAQIDLAGLEPFTSAERVLVLSHPKHGAHGRIRVRLLFHPQILAKSRQKTSTFSSAGRAVTQIGGLPVSAGKGAFKGVTSVFRRGDKDHQDVVGVVPIPVPVSVSASTDLPAGQSSTHAVGGVMMGNGGQSAPFPLDGQNLAAEGHGVGSTQPPGILRVTILGAKDIALSETRAYVTVRVGDKEFKTKHYHKTATPEWCAFLFFFCWCSLRFLCVICIGTRCSFSPLRWLLQPRFLYGYMITRH